MACPTPLHPSPHEVAASLDSLTRALLFFPFFILITNGRQGAWGSPTLRVIPSPSRDTEFLPNFSNWIQSPHTRTRPPTASKAGWRMPGSPATPCKTREHAPLGRRSDSPSECGSTSTAPPWRRRRLPGLEGLRAWPPAHELRGPSGRVYAGTSIYNWEPADEPRVWAIRIVESKLFDPIILATIIANCCTMAWESPLDPCCTDKAAFIDVCEWIYLIIFTFEMFTKIVACAHALARTPWRARPARLDAARRVCDRSRPRDPATQVRVPLQPACVPEGRVVPARHHRRHAGVAPHPAPHRRQLLRHPRRERADATTAACATPRHPPDAPRRPAATASAGPRTDPCPFSHGGH